MPGLPIANESGDGQPTAGCLFYWRRGGSCLVSRKNLGLLLRGDRAASVLGTRMFIEGWRVNEVVLIFIMNGRQ